MKKIYRKKKIYSKKKIHSEKKAYRNKKDICLVIGGFCILAVFCAVLYVFTKRDVSEKVLPEVIQLEAVQPEATQSEGQENEKGQGEGMVQGQNTDLTQDADKADVQEPSADNVTEESGGKKLSILGDSISTFEGWIPDGYSIFFPMNGEVGNVDETWWKRLIDETGMQLCANGSSSGSTCSGDSVSIDDPAYACSDYRIEGLIGSGGAYPDIIIVYMGTNDCIKNIPIGENDGTKTVNEGVIGNFSDAYTLILDKLKVRYPEAQIFCCTLAQLGGWGTEQPFVKFVNELGLTSEDYSKRIETIASNKGLTVIDLINCGITVDNMQKYVSDGIHLNPAGMELVKNAVKEAVMSDE